MIFQPVVLPFSQMKGKWKLMHDCSSPPPALITFAVLPLMRETPKESLICRLAITCIKKPIIAILTNKNGSQAHLPYISFVNSVNFDVCRKTLWKFTFKIFLNLVWKIFLWILFFFWLDMKIVKWFKLKKGYWCTPGKNSLMHRKYF